MTDKQEKQEQEQEVKHQKLSVATFSFTSNVSRSDPWSPSDIDKMDAPDYRQYKSLVKECRFFSRRDPIASTVINKMVEIGITSLVFYRKKLSANEMRIFYGIKDELQAYAEDCAREYLITGMAVPEVRYGPVNEDKKKEMGIKKMSSPLILPVSMMVRDSATIKVNDNIGEPSYYAVIPENLIFFIMNQGMYPDGSVDKKKYQKLLALYPDFVADVRNGATEILLEDVIAIRRNPEPDSPYPTPYLQSALESLKHKRNLKRMDYSIAARAIAAIQQFRVGSDEFPVVEGEDDIFTSLKEQMAYRNSGGKDIERIFQLFTNHTVEIEWIYPPLDALLNDDKYISINEDIFSSLGFPAILTTGESKRSNTSDPEFATLSPVKTMVKMQNQILILLRDVVKELSKENNLNDVPEVRFRPISLLSFKNFIEGLKNLYDTGNLSRSTFADAFGYNFEEEAKQLEVDKEVMEEHGLEDFAPRPFSNQPGQPGKSPTNTTGKPTTQPKKEEKSPVEEKK